MGKLKVKDIRYEEFMGRMCEIKFVEVYTMDRLVDWIEDLVDIHYKVIWSSAHRMYLENTLKSNDYVFIDCKQKIDLKDNRILNYYQPVILMF